MQVPSFPTKIAMKLVWVWLGAGEPEGHPQDILKGTSADWRALTVDSDLWTLSIDLDRVCHGNNKYLIVVNVSVYGICSRQETFEDNAQ